MRARLTKVTAEQAAFADAAADDYADEVNRALADNIVDLCEKRRLRALEQVMRVATEDSADQSRRTHNVHRLTDAMECGSDTPPYLSDLGLRAGYLIEQAA